MEQTINLNTYNDVTSFNTEQKDNSININNDCNTIESKIDNMIDILKDIKTKSNEMNESDKTYVKRHIDFIMKKLNSIDNDDDKTDSNPESNSESNSESNQEFNSNDYFHTNDYDNGIGGGIDMYTFSDYRADKIFKKFLPYMLLYDMFYD